MLRTVTAWDALWLEAAPRALMSRLWDLSDVDGLWSLDRSADTRNVFRDRLYAWLSYEASLVISGDRRLCPKGRHHEWASPHCSCVIIGIAKVCQECCSEN